jgi:adenine deaminase
MATKNPGEYLARYHSHHGLPRTGMLEAGYRADITVFDSLRDLKAVHVLSAGRVSLRDGALTWRTPAKDFSPFTGSIHLPAPLKPEDFHVAGRGDSAMVRCINVISESLLTGIHQAELPVREKRIMPDAGRDIAMISVFERHHATGSHSTVFVHGLGLKRGALASTVAHDSHNLILVGYAPEEMARLGNYMMERGGGIAVSDGEVIHHLPLEIAGLMSTGDIESVISRYSTVKEAAMKLGSPLKNVFMTMSFLSLPVIPELRITDMGLVDVNSFSFVPLVE